MKSAIILSGYAALQGGSIVPDAKYPVTAQHLKKMLEGTGQFRVEVVEEIFPRVLESGELFDLDLLVLNFPRHLYEHIPRLPDAQEQGFSRFVRSGKGATKAACDLTESSKVKTTRRSGIGWRFSDAGIGD